MDRVRFRKALLSTPVCSCLHFSHTRTPMHADSHAHPQPWEGAALYTRSLEKNRLPPEQAGSPCTPAAPQGGDQEAVQVRPISCRPHGGRECCAHRAGSELSGNICVGVCLVTRDTRLPGSGQGPWWTYMPSRRPPAVGARLPSPVAVRSAASVRHGRTCSYVGSECTFGGPSSYAPHLCVGGHMASACPCPLRVPGGGDCLSPATQAFKQTPTQPTPCVAGPAGRGDAPPPAEAELWAQRLPQHRLHCFPGNLRPEGPAAPSTSCGWTPPERVPARHLCQRSVGTHPQSLARGCTHTHIHSHTRESEPACVISLAAAGDAVSGAIPSV